MPRAIQSFCMGNREHIYLQLLHRWSQSRSELCNPKNSSVCDMGTFEHVLHKLVWAYKWQFALLAWLTGMTS